MEHRDVFILDAIVEYCDKISAYLRDNKISEQDFYNDGYCQDICAFYCLQIGENAGSLSENFLASHPEIEWRKIIGFRNLIAHEYGSIDPKILWSIINKNIGELCEFCLKIISK